MREVLVVFFKAVQSFEEEKIRKDLEKQHKKSTPIKKKNIPFPEALEEWIYFETKKSKPVEKKTNPSQIENALKEIKKDLESQGFQGDILKELLTKAKTKLEKQSLVKNRPLRKEPTTKEIEEKIKKALVQRT